MQPTNRGRCSIRFSCGLAVVVVCIVTTFMNFWYLSHLAYNEPGLRLMSLMTTDKSILALPAAGSKLRDTTPCSTNLTALAKEVAMGGTIVFGVVNQEYAALGINLVESWQRSGVYSFFLVALDGDSATALENARIPCYLDRGRDPSVRRTADITLELLKEGLIVVQSNPDVIWKSDALLEIQESLHLPRSSAFSVEDRSADPIINAAVYYAKPVSASISLFDSATDEIYDDPLAEDGAIFTKILTEGSKDLKEYILPSDKFSSVSLQRKRRETITPPITIYSDAKERAVHKEWDLKEVGGWLLDDTGDRSFLAGPFLYFSVRSYEELKPSLKAAFIIGKLLKRIPIIPEIPCAYSASGVCPLRDALWPVDAFESQRLEYRVHSIFKHPKFKAARYARGVVGVDIATLDRPQQEQQQDEEVPPSPEGLTINEWKSIEPKDPTCGVTLKELLSFSASLKEVPILHFSSLFNKLKLDAKEAKELLNGDEFLRKLETALPFAIPSPWGCSWWKEDKRGQREALTQALSDSGSSLHANLPMDQMIDMRRPINLLIFGDKWYPYAYEHLNVGGKTLFLEDAKKQPIRPQSYSIEYPLPPPSPDKMDAIAAIKANAIKVPSEVYDTHWDMIVINPPRNCDVHAVKEDTQVKQRIYTIFSIFQKVLEKNSTYSANTTDVFIFSCSAGRELPKFARNLGDTRVRREGYKKYAWKATDFNNVQRLEEESNVEASRSSKPLASPISLAEEKRLEEGLGGKRERLAEIEQTVEEQMGEKLEENNEESIITDDSKDNQKLPKYNNINEPPYANKAMFAILDRARQEALAKTQTREDKKESETDKEEKSKELEIEKEQQEKEETEKEDEEEYKEQGIGLPLPGEQQRRLALATGDIGDRLKKAVTDNPKDVSAWESYLIYIHDLAADKNTKETKEEAFEQCVKEANMPNCNGIKLKIASRKAHKKAYKQARELFEEVLSVEPLRVDAWGEYLRAAELYAPKSELSALFDRMFAKEELFTQDDSDKLQTLRDEFIDLELDGRDWKEEFEMKMEETEKAKKEREEMKAAEEEKRKTKESEEQIEIEEPERIEEEVKGNAEEQLEKLEEVEDENKQGKTAKSSSEEPKSKSRVKRISANKEGSDSSTEAKKSKRKEKASSGTKPSPTPKEQQQKATSQKKQEPSSKALLRPPSPPPKKKKKIPKQHFQ